MLTDALLVFVHLSAMLALAVFLTAATGVLRCGPHDASRLARLARLQLWVWGSLAAMALSGLALLWWGAKGPTWPLQNPLFWAKVALWAGMVAMAVPVSHSRRRWRDAAALPNWQLAPGRQKRAVRWLMLQAHIMVMPPLLGVLIARGLG